MEKYNSRADVPDKYKWDLTAYFKSNEEVEAAIKEGERFISLIPSYVGCTKDATKLLEFMNLMIEANTIIENLYVYTYLINDQELGNSTSMQNKSRVENLYAKFSSVLSFFDPELLTLTNEEYEELFVSVPELSVYKKSLDETFRGKEHILSEAEEKISTELSSAADHYDDMSSTMLNSEHDYGTVDIDGESTQITSTNYSSLMKNKDRELRKQIREQYSKVLEQYGNSSAQFLNSYVGLREAISKMKKFDNAWDSKMFWLKIDEKVFETLVSTVEDNTSSLQEYFKLFAEMLGVDVITDYDAYMDLTSSDKKYTIEEAQDLILKALEPLGKDYLEHFKKIFDKHYIDYCEYKGKCSGAYSFGTSTNDSRILMSFNGELDDVSTIAHEGGHNVHHQYVQANNPVHYRDISSIVCEVASLTNECLLSSYLADNGESVEERLAGIDNILGVILSNLFGAVREGKIEQDFHNEYLTTGSITKDFMDKLNNESLKKYYGDTRVIDEYSSVSWMRRSHYYMNYYLYSYAISICVASYVAKHILSGDKEMLDKYIKFLSTGGDAYVEEAFSVLGVDLTNKEVYEGAISYFDEMVEKYKTISKTRK